MLCRLGKLPGWKDAPPPGGQANGDAAPVIDGAEVDTNFQRRKDFQSYSHMYASNLDKMIAVALGSAATSTIWFGAVDHIYYSDALIGDPDRINFLAGTLVFYFDLLLIGTISYFIHKYLWRWDMDHNLVPYKTIKATTIVAIILFCVIFFLATISHLPFSSVGVSVVVTLSHFFSGSSEDYCFGITQIILLVIIAIPLFLLHRGEQLATAMTTEADRCVRHLKAQASAEVIEATLEPDDPA